jgi:uncharacterized protein (TIGR03083 family)
MGNRYDVAHRDLPQAEQLILDVDPAMMLTAYARHRRRFAAEVGELDKTALGAPSRCSDWTVADTLRHCCDVDGWMQTIWAGEPLPFSSFDPRKTPDEWVAAGRSVPDAEVRDRYVASTELMATDVDASTRERWGTPSLSPLGFVPWWLSTMHVFYDSWVHERDVFVPLGIEPPVVDDETLPVLAYSLGIVGIFNILNSEPNDAVVAGVRVTAGEGPVVVIPVGDGDSNAEVAAIIDALSGRGRVEEVLRGVDPEVVHRLGALARMFASDP